MTAINAPTIYVGQYQNPPRVSLTGRLLSAGVAATCLGVLVIAAELAPSPTGVGTHRAMGLGPCQFLAYTGLPCPGCGMTTAFSWFARCNIEASLYVQPMGTILAILCAATFWGASYVALTARPAYRLAQRIPPRYYLWYLPSLAIVAWAWKIWIRVHRLDGWH
jgi:hypothetical protein